jgi:hypothetical protein
MLSCSPVPPQSNIRIATDAEGVERLRRLVEILRHLEHPSVVAVASTTFSDDHAEVMLDDITGEPLLSTLIDTETLMRVAGNAAAALAHVHERSVALGSIDEATFVRRKDHSVVILGFEAAIMPAGADDKQADIQALAFLVKSVLTDPDPLREKINGPSESALRDAMVRILDQAERGDLDARQMAEKLRHAVFFESTTSTKRRIPDRRFPLRTGRGVVITAIVAAVCAAVVGTTRLQSDAAAVNEPTRKAPSCELRTGTTIDVDGDGCLDGIEFREGMVTVNGERYAVGQPGDETAVGDWACNDLPTLVLLRPGTGELFVFDDWPATGSSATPRKLMTDPSARSPRTKPRGECEVLTVTTDAGDIELDPKKANR